MTQDQDMKSPPNVWRGAGLPDEHAYSGEAGGEAASSSNIKQLPALAKGLRFIVRHGRSCLPLKAAPRPAPPQQTAGFYTVELCRRTRPAARFIPA